MNFLQMLFCLQFLHLIQNRYIPTHRYSKLGANLQDSPSNDSETCSYGGVINNSIIQLGNCNDILFNIELSIGSPSQNFYFQLDTGSNVLWLPTIQTLSKGFNSSASSTYNITDEQYSLSYADNSGVSGYAGSDIVKVQNTPIDANSPILFVTTETNMSFPGQVIGIVGMGYSDLPNFLDQAYLNKQIATNTFALNLSHPSEKSYLFFNNIPSWIVENTINSNVYGFGYWQLKVVGVYFGSDDLTGYSVNKAVIDSGTTLFYLNPVLFDNIYISYFSSSCKRKFGTIICPCSLMESIPPIKIMFTGTAVEIYPQDYFFSINNSTQCLVELGTLSDESDILLLGDTLFYNYIITFNKNQASVGFCQNYDSDSNSSSGQNRKPITVSPIGSQWFITAQWIMMSFALVILIFMIYLLYHLRMVPRKTIRQKMIENNVPIHPTYKQPTNIPRGVPVSNQYATRQMQMNNINY